MMHWSFFIIAAVTVLSAMAAMSLRNIVHCALLLTITFAGLAAFYLQLNAQFVGFAQRCKLLIVLVSPVHIDAASLAIFYIVIIHGSTLWTLCHLYAPLVNKILHRIRLVRRKLDH